MSSLIHAETSYQVATRERPDITSLATFATLASGCNSNIGKTILVLTLENGRTNLRRQVMLDDLTNVLH
jgi:hypothetical protein